MDFIIRLFCRWHHNLIVSSCCNNGVSLPKEVYDPQKTLEEDDLRPPDEVYFDAVDEISSQA
jgi:hypothetical protein